MDARRASTTSAWLGVDALWLSPIYPSPDARLRLRRVRLHRRRSGLRNARRLRRAHAARRPARHRRAARHRPLLTSIEHPWFREHPDWYIWADAPNNWSSAFGGSAWSALDGRYYLHSFYPEQPDLDWRNPGGHGRHAGRAALLARARVAGYRIDAIDRLLKDPSCAMTRPRASRSACPCARTRPSSRSRNSRNAPTPARPSPRSARRWGTPSWWGRSTCRARSGSRTSITSTPPSRSRLPARALGGRRAEGAIAASTHGRARRG